MIHWKHTGFKLCCVVSVLRCCLHRHILYSDPLNSSCVGVYLPLLNRQMFALTAWRDSNISSVLIPLFFFFSFQVGGRNLSLQNNTESSALSCYNPMTNQWSQRVSLNIPRNRVGVAVVDGCIYAVGGSQGSTHHNTVEKWDTNSLNQALEKQFDFNGITPQYARISSPLYAHCQVHLPQCGYG